MLSLVTKRVNRQVITRVVRSLGCGKAPTLSVDNVSTRIVELEYAVRGKTVAAAAELDVRNIVRVRALIASEKI